MFVFTFLVFSFFAVFAQSKTNSANIVGTTNIQNNSDSSEQEIKTKTLKEIDILISETDYSVALIELSDYLKKYPDELDFVQKRIDKIMKARQQYIVLANELIDVMEKDPENAQLKLEIISKLETVEKNPTEEQLSFIRQAKIAAQFTYYRSQFRKIVDASSNSVSTGEYSSAVSQIQKGFGMYRQEFYEENPKSVTDNVTAIVNRINNSCREYSTMQDKLKNAYNAFINAVKNSNYSDATKTFSNFNSEMQNLATIRNELYKDANSLQEIFKTLQSKNPELTEASYLPFIFRFTLGLENDSQSGIIGAMDTQFVKYVEGAKPVIYETICKNDIGKIDESNVATVKQNEFPLLKLDSIKNFSNLAVVVNSMYNKLNYKVKYPVEYPEYVRSMDYAKTVSVTLLSSYQIVNEYQAINENLKSIQKPENPVEAIRSKDSYAMQMIACSKNYEECANNANALLNEKWFLDYSSELEENAKGKENKKDQILKYKILDLYYSTLNKTLVDVCTKASQLQWKQTALYFASASDEICNYYQDEYKKADELLLNHYPEEAKALIVKTEKELDLDAQTLILCRDTLAESSKMNKSSFEQEEKEVVLGVSKMNNFKQESQNTFAKCNEEILLSQRALNEAELRYNQAVTAFKNSNYTQARKSIELSSSKYKEAFDHQESPVIREEADKKLFALGQQINDAENKIIVAEVRKLKNQAKSEYYNGNFEKAETLLAQAKSRWAVTNGAEEDEEIKNLQALVETALSMKTGRVIPPTAPLYPEMSQLLSIAHQYYDQGSILIKKNEREQAVDILTQAKKKLQEVQLVYPLNQEASLLTLKIDQLIDPESFNDMFVQKVNVAKDSYKIAGKQQTAYTDLLDLYEIKPNYPGLKQLIYNVEIEIGVRQKPVDTTSIVRSQSLTREAQQIVNGAASNETQLRNALAKLDQAILLNPNNDQAILLKDRVQVSLGGRASVVLSSSDEAKYQQAIQYLQKNNTLDAYTLVQQLLQNPANRRSSKVLDLEKKVKALL